MWTYGAPSFGPDALDPELTLEAFLARLRQHHGEIKGILTRGTAVAGIGDDASRAPELPGGAKPAIMAAR